jgi:hypothetical protein
MPRPSSRKEFDKNYRRKHWVLRIAFTAAEHERLQKAFGGDVHQTARRLIRVEMLKREFMTPDKPS